MILDRFTGKEIGTLEDIRAGKIKDLRGADLRRADLTGANLIGASLLGADISHTEIKSFNLGNHFAWLHIGEQYPKGSYLKIGCYGESLSHWMDNYEQLGLKNEYSKQEIKDYGDMIIFISNKYKA